MQPIPAHEGLLAHLVRSVRPDLADRIGSTGIIETAVIGLGGQGTRPAGPMQAFGTRVVGGVAPGRAGERIHETIPVFESVSELLEAHPNLAGVSIWRHFSSARDAALEAIEAEVPLVVLITEGIPLRDVRDVREDLGPCVSRGAAPPRRPRLSRSTKRIRQSLFREGEVWHRVGRTR